MRVLRWFLYLVGGVAALLAILLIGARFADGPVGIVAGGSLESGELVTESEIDWSFAEDIATIEFQLENPPRSRTVWIAVHEGQLYVPCGYLDMPIWKQWPHEALEDGRAVLRVDGKRYERHAVKVEDPALHAAVAAIVGEKYTGGTGTTDMDQLWIFRMDPRPGA